MARRRSQDEIPVYLEVGNKRVFAGAIEWPGWCRSGKSEEASLDALAAYAPRYATALRGTKLGFPPGDATAFQVLERLEGDASTDFGAPGKAPAADERPVDDVEFGRMQAILRACWRSLDGAAEAAEGKVLTKGPRGGGRDLDKILRHVLEADAGYLGRIGAKYGPNEGRDPTKELVRIRPFILGALSAVACGEPVRTGPRGGVRWTARYFVRRSAWHVLDHAWEIEDRAAR
ncbi:MAG TPA: hypothetical protein VF986_01765 [Actinomycetota bacterium]